MRLGPVRALAAIAVLTAVGATGVARAADRARARNDHIDVSTLDYDRAFVTARDLRPLFRLGTPPDPVVQPVTAGTTARTCARDNQAAGAITVGKVQQLVRIPDGAAGNALLGFADLGDAMTFTKESAAASKGCKSPYTEPPDTFEPARRQPKLPKVGDARSVLRASGTLAGLPREAIQIVVRRGQIVSLLNVSALVPVKNSNVVEWAKALDRHLRTLLKKASR